MSSSFEPGSKTTPDEEIIVQKSIPREHKFVIGLHHNKKDAAKSRQEVRSHVARVAANQSNGDSSAVAPKSQVLRRRRRRGKNLMWQVAFNVPAEAAQSINISIRPVPSISSGVPAVDSPAARLPFAPLILDNYLEHLAVAVPELDGPDQTMLLRTVWFPMVVHYPVLFQIIVLFSASHYAARHKDMTMASDILSLKHLAITGLRDAVARAERQCGDDTIASAAKMASYEAIFGAESAYHTHMSGVANMVKLRGGLTTLGLDGFLSRLLQFIDTNSAFILNCELHLDESNFPKQVNQFLPNPSRFLGFS